MHLVHNDLFYFKLFISSLLVALVHLHRYQIFQRHQSKYHDICASHIPCLWWNSLPGNIIQHLWMFKETLSVFVDTLGKDITMSLLDNINLQIWFKCHDCWCKIFSYILRCCKRNATVAQEFQHFHGSFPPHITSYDIKDKSIIIITIWTTFYIYVSIYILKL